MKTFILITIFIAISGMLRAATYYVSTTGNDGWSGTSISSAWRHIAYASSVVVAGDTILVLPGTYIKEYVVFDNSGTSGSPIILTAYDTTNIPILDGMDTTGDAITIGTGLGIDARDYINVSRLVITRYEGGIYARGGESVNISNCEVYLTGGIGIYFVDIKNSSIDRCEVHDNGWNSVMLQANYRTDAGYSSVTNCKIHDNPGNSGSSGHNLLDFFNYQESLTDIDVIGNVIYNSDQQGIFFHESTNPLFKNFRIKNNIVANSWNGIFADALENSEINNNTLYNLVSDGILVWVPDQSNNVTIKNNIVVDCYIGINAQNLTFNISYNDIWSNSNDAIRGPIGTGNKYLDPLFADPINYDFHLQSQYGRWNGSSWVNDAVNSPCIDAGDPLDDYLNEPIPNGGRINMGAYGNTIEASKSSGPSGEIEEQQHITEFALHQNYPNPFNPETNITFDLPTNSFVSLRIFNLIGQEVAVLVNGQLPAGTHSYKVGREQFELASGVYFYKLSAGEFVQTRKMMMVR